MIFEAIPVLHLGQGAVFCAAAPMTFFAGSRYNFNPNFNYHHFAFGGVS